MPILGREAERFPEGVLDLAEDRFPWWVVRTRSRQDKALARFLFPLEIPFYLPCRKHRARRAGRWFVSYLPLFPGYVFCRGSMEQRQAALRSKLIVQILDVQDQAMLSGELLQINELLKSGAELVPYCELVPGSPVTIREGPFNGYRGVVLRARGRLRLLVSISMIKQTVSVELGREVVAPSAPDSPNRQKACTRVSANRQKDYGVAVS